MAKHRRARQAPGAAGAPSRRRPAPRTRRARARHRAPPPRALPDGSRRRTFARRLALDVRLLSARRFDPFGACFGGSPPDHSDVEELHGRSYPQRRGGLAAQRNLVERGVHVGREQPYQDEHQADARNPPGSRDEQTDRARDLEQPRQVYDPEEIGRGGGDHRREVMFHAGEVAEAGEQEHDHQGDAASIPPRGEALDSEPAQTPQENERSKQNEQGYHVSPFGEGRRSTLHLCRDPRWVACLLSRHFPSATGRDYWPGLVSCLLSSLLYLLRSPGRSRPPIPVPSVRAGAAADHPHLSGTSPAVGMPESW